MNFPLPRSTVSSTGHEYVIKTRAIHYRFQCANLVYCHGRYWFWLRPRYKDIIWFAVRRNRPSISPGQMIVTKRDNVNILMNICLL